MRRPVLSLCFFMVVLYFGFPSTAWAYIDPATTSYIIQIVSGLIISLSVAAGVFASRLKMGAVTVKARAEAFWLRMRNKRYRQLYRKAQEKEKARLKELKAAQPRVSLAQYLFADTRRLRLRLLIAALLAACFSFSFVFFGCFDIVITNRNAMPYPPTLVFGAIALMSLGVFAALFVVLVLLRGRAFTAFATLVLALTLVFYCQGNFMNGSLGQLTGDWLDLGAIVGSVIFNTIVCFVVLMLPFALWRFAPKAHQAALMCIPSLLIIMQGVALITSISNTGILEERVEPQAFLSTENLYELAPQDNIVVILLDRLDNAYIDELLQREPNYFEGYFDGFTRYTNNISTTSRTYPSVVNMLTGYTYRFDTPAADFMHDAWTGSSFLPGLREAGYRSDVYTEYSYCYLNGNDLSAAADNIDEGLPAIDATAVNNLITITCYRYMPFLFKVFFWTSSDAISKDVEFVGEQASRYQADDHAFYNQLVSDGLHINAGINSNFKFIHLNGTHPPFNAGADLSEVAREESNLYYQSRFAFAEVFAYLDALKELGLYEDTTIIITGDHGYTKQLDYLGDFSDLTEPILTGLFVKLSGASGMPLQESRAPVNSDNLRATVWQQAGLAYQAQWGRTYEEVPLNDLAPRAYMFQVGLSGSNEKHIELFEVIGDAQQFSNWHVTGKEPMRYYHGYQGG